MRLARPVSFRRGTLVLVLGVASAVACGPPERGSDRPSGAAVPSEPPGAEELDRLSALGYVDFKPPREADGGLAGVTRHDPGKAAPGLNLFSNRDGRAFLMDMSGDVVHRWSLGRTVEDAENRFCFHAELFRNGDLGLLCSSDALYRLDRESKLVWAFRGRVHHDFVELPDDRLLVLGRENRTYRQQPGIVFDNLLLVGPDGGDEGVLWSSFDHLEELRRFHGPSFVDGLMPLREEAAFWRRVGYDGERFQYHHLNSVELLPPTPLGETDPRFRAGNLLVSARHVNNVFVLDRDTGRPVWSWSGTPALDWQHHAVMLANGNVLVFDNGTRRGSSRVLELDPVNQEPVWAWEAEPADAFYTARAGDAQRLPNGNTVICESEKGRVFEVTGDGEIVWEFWHPERSAAGRKTIYRMERLAADDPAVVALLRPGG